MRNTFHEHQKEIEELQNNNSSSECPECNSKWDTEHNRCSINCQTIL